jgi:DNA polymerase-3 subunit alpha
LETALKWKKERDELQLYLFGFEEEINWTIDYPDIRPFTVMQQLELERELLGIFLSGHPLDAFEQLLEDGEVTSIVHLLELPDHSDVHVAGMVVSIKTILTKKGQQMAFIELEDRIDKVEVVLFPETWKRFGSFVNKGSLLLIKAKLQQQDEDVKLLAEQVAALNDPRLQNQLLQQIHRSSSLSNRAQPKQQPSQKQQRVFIKIVGDQENSSVLARLKAKLREHPGALQVVLFYEREQKSVALNNQYNVTPTDDLLHAIETLMGAGAIKVK